MRVLATPTALFLNAISSVVRVVIPPLNVVLRVARSIAVSGGPTHAKKLIRTRVVHQLEFRPNHQMKS